MRGTLGAGGGGWGAVQRMGLLPGDRGCAKGEGALSWRVMQGVRAGRGQESGPGIGPRGLRPPVLSEGRGAWDGGAHPRDLRDGLLDVLFLGDRDILGDNIDPFLATSACCFSKPRTSCCSTTASWFIMS